MKEEEELRVFMKNIISGAIILIIITLSVSGCTNGHDKTFDNDEIIFEYHQSWVNASYFWPHSFGFNYTYGNDPDLDAQEVAFVLDPHSATSNEKYTTWLKVEKKAMSPDSSMETVLNESYNKNFSSYKSISKYTRLGLNTTAYEIRYQKYQGGLLYQVMDVWQEKNGTIYIISCWSLPENYETSRGYFQDAITTLHIKE